MSKKKRSGHSSDKNKTHTKNTHKVNPLGLLGVVAELINQLAFSDSPSDFLVASFLRERPNLGARDRAVVAEAAFCWLRMKLRIEHLAQIGAVDYVLRQAKLALLISGAPEEIWSKGKTEDNEWLSQAMNVRVDSLPVDAATCLPLWFYNKLSNTYGDEITLNYAAFNLQSAPLDLRVNTLKTSTKSLLSQLNTVGFFCEEIPGLSTGIRVEGKPNLTQTTLFKEGFFEFQDAGSQWVSKLVAPRRGDLVIDFCAGAGGKTLAIAALMKNTGRVIAVDNHEKRLLKFKPRAVRAGLSNYSTLCVSDESDSRLSKFYAKADRVLVDVPCSGSGTLRRNPGLKYKYDNKAITEFAETQRRILSKAADLVRPDGRLIYITCSVFAEENHEQVEQFLAQNPAFRLRRWTEVLPPADRPSGADESSDTLFMWPHKTNTDGFFAAVLQRIKAE